ncbi:hypothetical protein RQM47_06650 [Rubrivirga sp. S365]|uniref:Uncharacterized protein n=1 Tax=Rubrivirga litoralis TaxID=3075598 RepID=A0ABU3BSN9_9BACT|nr:MULTISPECIES: hypothetical protein [unclassified Rubrivirga]MDT0632302.1 hypothetical protein [Rubrivirga sp. F394]MDT7856313.1 hypothetical protein [Rubrivirga sp. S365]
MPDRPAPPRMDRSAFSVASSFEEAEEADRAWWWAQTPEFRLQTAQYLREVNYGDAATARLQRVIEFAERERS